MNKNILHTGVQNFISENLNADIMSVLLRKDIFEHVSSKELVQQIESKKKCKKKLPLWFKTPKIYYPEKLNIEQTSSEITAQYKAEIVKGKSLLDMTGGFGIDSYYFSKKIDTVSHVEIDVNLAQISQYNFEVLGAKNIQNFNADGLSFLSQSDKQFDWIYIDPSRRNLKKGKVVFLEDYTPNITTHKDLLFSKADNILLKTAPLLDLSAGMKTLKHVKEIHIVAVNNEVKELLWWLNNGFMEEPIIKTINLKTNCREIFDFKTNEESQSASILSKPKKYLYEPNASLLKSGAFKLIGQRFKLEKLHQHTHLYTSDQYIDFPGRRFLISHVHPYNKSTMRAFAFQKANITTRNFPESVSSIRKKFKIKNGGDTYLFFFKNLENRNQFLVTQKI